MQIYTLSKKGESHKLRSEDALFFDKINERYHIFVVSDGCSSGVDSYFPSALFCKVMQGIVFDIKRKKITLPKENILKFLLNIFWEKIWEIITQINLPLDEALATLLVAFYDQETQEMKLVISGDGVFKIDEQLIEIDADNQPKYLAYFLYQSINFEEWYEKYTSTFDIQNPADFTLSTDGVMTFKTWKTEQENEEFSPVEYLLENKDFENSSNMLTKKATILEKKYGYLPFDDVSIIRIIF
jgi:hypothetical protein